MSNVDNRDGVFEEAGGCLRQNGSQGALQNGAAADDPLTEFLQSLTHLQRQHVVAIVDDDPAHPPARNQVPATIQILHEVTSCNGVGTQSVRNMSEEYVPPIFVSLLIHGTFWWDLHMSELEPHRSVTLVDGNHARETPDIKFQFIRHSLLLFGWIEFWYLRNSRIFRRRWWERSVWRPLEECPASVDDWRRNRRDWKDCWPLSPPCSRLFAILNVPDPPPSLGPPKFNQQKSTSRKSTVVSTKLMNAFHFPRFIFCLIEIGSRIYIFIFTGILEFIRKFFWNSDWNLLGFLIFFEYSWTFSGTGILRTWMIHQGSVFFFVGYSWISLTNLEIVEFGLYSQSFRQSAI